MQADIRLPIGLLFLIVGVLITIFGFATTGAEMYRHSLGININIYSGICMTIFGNHHARHGAESSEKVEIIIPGAPRSAAALRRAFLRSVRFAVWRTAFGKPDCQRHCRSADTLCPAWRKVKIRILTSIGPRAGRLAEYRKTRR